MTACDDFVSVNAQCAHALLNRYNRCFCALVYPRSSCHVNLTRHLLWSHGWWKMDPTDRKVYINTLSIHFLQAIEISQIFRASSCGLLSESTLINSWWFQWIVFQISILKMKFVTEKYSSWLKNSENCKICNSYFQNFRKIDLIILANRSNRSNRKKSLNWLDWFIGQRINIHISGWSKRHQRSDSTALKE